MLAKAKGIARTLIGRLPRATVVPVVRGPLRGAEADLMAGAAKLIERHRPTIVMSLHIGIPAAKGIASWLESRGYSVGFAEVHDDLVAVYRER